MPGGRKTKVEELRIQEQRARQGEISGTIPVELKGDKEAIRCYRSVLEVTEGSHMLTPADTGLLTLYCETWSQYRACINTLKTESSTTKGSRGNLVLSPVVKLRLSLLESLRKLGADLGLSPVSRKRLAMALGSETYEDGDVDIVSQYVFDEFKQK